jgi:hypothetical protein
VRIGNHSNCHFRFRLLAADQAATELQGATRDFTRLFGAEQDFAFPFGTPERDFGARDVELVRRGGARLIWSTERRPFRSSERAPGAVLPRFPVNGTWSHRQIAAWIAARALVFRARGSPHRY